MTQSTALKRRADFSVSQDLNKTKLSKSTQTIFTFLHSRKKKERNLKTTRRRICSVVLRVAFCIHLEDEQITHSHVTNYFQYAAFH